MDIHRQPYLISSCHSIYWRYFCLAFPLSIFWWRTVCCCKHPLCQPKHLPRSPLFLVPPQCMMPLRVKQILGICPHIVPNVIVPSSFQSLKLKRGQVNRPEIPCSDVVFPTTFRYEWNSCFLKTFWYVTDGEPKPNYFELLFS